MLEFEFPDTGEGVTEGKFLKWLVEKGEEIEEDDVVAEVETDKAVVDVPAPTSGTINELKAEKGDTIKVGDVIMVIDDGSGGKQSEKVEESESEENTSKESSEETNSEPKKKGKQSNPRSGSSSNAKAMPKVRKLAEEKNVDIEKIDKEIVEEEDVLEAAGDNSKAVENNKEPAPEQHENSEKDKKSSNSDLKNVSARPSVRQLARDKGIDISEVEGTGRGGEVTREDVLSFDSGEEQESETAVKEDTATEENSVSGKRESYTGVRKVIGERMADSRKNIPHVTHVEKADITELVELREQEKDNVDVHLTYLPFMLKAVVDGMKKYPELNSELDRENEEIILHDSYDFNIAVDTENGLMVPLLENVGEKSIVDLAGEIGELAGEAKHGELSASDMENGTFSVTNLGVIGGEEFTPIINPPQAAILGIGRIKETAEVVEEEITPRMTVKLSLSYDHRIIDGADAARFMNEIVENLEDPQSLLMKL